MTHDEAETIASIAKHNPDQLPNIADDIRRLARNWQAISMALHGCDIGRTNGRIVLTLVEGVELRDLYEIDVL